MTTVSRLTKDQSLTESRTWTETLNSYELTVILRYDDRCGNGHNTFSVTGVLYVNGRWDSGGCLHELIQEHFPGYRHLIKWHLVSSDGPTHYVANTLYHVSDRDCWGLRKGERRQIRNGKTRKLSWKRAILDSQGQEVEPDKYLDSDTKPPITYTVEYVPWEHIGEGKARELDLARSTAVWPDATDEELLAPDLESKLIARLPRLLDEFKRDIEALGFTY